MRTQCTVDFYDRYAIIWFLWVAKIQRTCSKFRNAFSFSCWMITGQCQWLRYCWRIDLFHRCYLIHALIFLCRLRTLSVRFQSMVLFCRPFVKACRYGQVACSLLSICVDCWLCWRLAVYCACLSDMTTFTEWFTLNSKTSHSPFCTAVCHRSIYSQHYGVKNM